MTGAAATSMGSTDAPSPRQRVLLLVAMLAAGVWMVALLLPPLVQPGVDPLRAHPEDQAGGSFGLVVNVGYAALAVSLVAIVVVLAPYRGWPRVGLVLLLLAAVLCVPLAASPALAPRLGVLLVAGVLGLAVGPLVLALGLRRSMRSHRAAATVLAVCVVACFLFLVLAPATLSGAINRLFDLLVGAWLVVFGIALRSGFRGNRGVWSCVQPERSVFLS